MILPARALLARFGLLARRRPPGAVGILGRACLVVLLALTAVAPLPAAAVDWTDRDAAGERRVHLYFFWSATCAHCQAARPFVEALPARHRWLVLHSHALDADPAAADLYTAIAAAIGEPAQSVPAFVYCGRVDVGFDRPETSGQALEAALLACRRDGALNAETGGKAAAAIELPGFGPLTPERLSLPVFTLVIAGLDAFNPCAFFVLLFLLSLLIHAGSRRRMLFVGGIFVFCSGFIYFLFMSAWLNVFRWLGEIALVTTAAGVLAVLLAIVNIKDYLGFRKGISLSIPDAAKHDLFHRVRGLLRADKLPALTVGTIALAVAANTYELLCTAGFPMIYTRLLTLSGLPPGAHYAYLALYNLIYVLPLLAITLIFVRTLGSRKLSATEGRLLKLLSGLMMLGLGILLVVAPASLDDLRIAVTLPLAAAAIAWLVHRLSAARNSPRA